MALALAWGGHRNGNIPLPELHPVPNFSPLGLGFSDAAKGSNLMKTEAAVQLSGLMQAFYYKFRKRLLLSEGYRPEEVQDLYWDRYIYRKPHWTIAALPPTSIHGWGLSADLAVEGVGNPSGEYLKWLDDNAWKYGFFNDVTTEPWHWSYRTDIGTRTIKVTIYVTNPNTLPDIPEAVGGTMDEIELIPIQNTKTKNVDWYLVNFGKFAALHVASTVQLNFLRNIGVVQKIKDTQSKAVLAGFVFVNGAGAKVS